MDNKTQQASKAPELTYEEAVAELEKTVILMEKGELSLEASLLAFEKGIGLVRLCGKKLDDIEKRMTLLVEGRGEIKETDFNAEENL